MSLSHSPLRYPGEKAVLSDFMMDVILGNNLEGCSYIEPFAGGAGAALTLRFQDMVKELYLNGADKWEPHPSFSTRCKKGVKYG
ncbi:MAG: hypothetical protein MUF15_08880 [Acidobacteria bacterium]|nr:hypothetical protein [Acidobacteriota bacterium]